MVGRWPAALAALADDVTRRLPAPPAAADDPGGDGDRTRDVVVDALGARLGFGPASPPDSPLLTAARRVGESARRLEGHGWVRVVPAARDDSLGELVSDTLRARAVLTRHLRRVHLEVLPRHGATGTPGSWLGVLSTDGSLVVVDEGGPVVSRDELADLELFVVATAEIAAVWETAEADARLRGER